MSIDYKVESQGLKSWALVQHEEVDVKTRDPQRIQRRGCCGEAGEKPAECEDEQKTAFQGSGAHRWMGPGD